MSGKRVVDISEYESRPNSENFFAILNKCRSATGARGKHVTPYSKMIAIGPEGEHFCWFHYREGRDDVDCVIEPAIPDPQVNDVKELLNQAHIRRKGLHRPRSGSKTIDIHVNAEQVKREDIWSCLARVLEISSKGA